MVVFVTGANGLVGSFVVKELLKNGHRPKLLIRDGANLDLIKDSIPFCEVVSGDILDSLMLEQHLNGCEVVIHTAGIVSFDSNRKKEIYTVNVEGTSNIVNACLKTGVRKIVHVSSIAALSRPNVPALINEKTKWEESSFNSSYAKSKYLAELEVFRGGEEGLDFTILNPSVIIGPGDKNKSSTKLFGFIEKMPWFYPNGYINHVDVRDVAVAACKLLNTEHRNRLILNAGVVTYKDLYASICRSAGMRPAFSIQLPKISLYILAYWSVLKSIFVKSEPIVTLENCKHLSRKYEYKSTYYDALFATRLIQLEESIEYTMAGLHQN